MATDEPAGDGRVTDIDLHVTEFVQRMGIADRLEEPHLGHWETSNLSTASFDNPSGQWGVYASADIEPPRFESFEAFHRERVVERGVDVGVVNAFNNLSRRPTKEYARALMRAFNDVLVEELVADYDDLYCLVELAVQYPEDAAAEIERFAADDRVVGALVGPTGTYPPLGHEEYDVIYRTAEDHGMPIVYHPNATESFEQEFPFQWHGFESFFGVHSLAGPWTGMLTAADLIEKATPEKFPDLDFVFLEIDFTIAPFLMGRFNEGYSMRSKQLPLLQQDPEKYMREAFHYGTHPLGSDTDRVRRMMELVGHDSLMFASGAPGYDEDTPERFDEVVGRALPPEDRSRIVADNAARVFGV